MNRLQKLLGSRALIRTTGRPGKWSRNQRARLKIARAKRRGMGPDAYSVWLSTTSVIAKLREVGFMRRILPVVEVASFERVRVTITQGAWKGEKGWITGPKNEVGANPVTTDSGLQVVWFDDELEREPVSA